MLNWQKHKTKMIEILKAIYTDVEIAPFLIFKGGTACYLFYDLPRYSVDLDFDLLEYDKRDLVFRKIKNHLLKLGETKDEKIKKNTIFFLYSYKNGEQNIKVEISTRGMNKKYDILDFFGINMKVMVKEDIFANKLVALSDRSSVASRDIFDINFFLDKMWGINEKIIKERTNKNLSDYLLECINIIKEVSERKLLFGLGDLVDEKQKHWIRNKMKEEIIFKINVLRN